MRVNLRSTALLDLQRIAGFYAEHNPTYTRKISKELRAKAGELSRFPLRGKPMPGLGEGMRALVHGNFLILYQVNDHEVAVLRVIDGRRDIAVEIGDE